MEYGMSEVSAGFYITHRTSQTWSKLITCFSKFQKVTLFRQKEKVKIINTFHWRLIWEIHIHILNSAKHSSLNVTIGMFQLSKVFTDLRLVTNNEIPLGSQGHFQIQEPIGDSRTGLIWIITFPLKLYQCCITCMHFCPLQCRDPLVTFLLLYS